MSAHGRALPSATVGSDAHAEPSTAADSDGGGALNGREPHDRGPRVTAPAWGAIGITLSFIAFTCWWLTVDRSIPVYDVGSHLEEALIFHNLISAGDIGALLNYHTVYPPLGHLVGAFAAFVGGLNIAAPVIGENVVFVPLLILGIYQTGKLLFGPTAGLLASIFVLGSPLLIVQFHMFLLDAPETALVAVSIWLILASEHFTRVRVAGLAGLAVGAGLLIKVQFPFFIVGIVLATLLRGGWRNWRGFALFVAVALLVGTPWYLNHLSEFSRVAQVAGADPGAPPSAIPPTFSAAGLEWYFWSTLNSQLLAPLFLMLLIGAGWLILALIRGDQPRGVRLEFLIGCFIAWLGISLTRHHDIRYDIPLMPYLAVIATGWIVFMPRVTRLLATAALVLIVAINTLSNTFGYTLGMGGHVVQALAHPLPSSEASPQQIVFFSNEVFFVAEPQRDGDVLGLLRAMRRDGVRAVGLEPVGVHSDFTNEGLTALAFIAKLPSSNGLAGLDSEPRAAALIYQPALSGGPQPCTRLGTGAGVLVARSDPGTGKLRYYCPFPRSHYYGKVPASE